MAQKISFRCASCAARIKAHIQLTGRMRRCPNCRAEIIVPNLDGDLEPWSSQHDADPIVVMDGVHNSKLVKD